MSAHNQNRTKVLETVKSSAVDYRVEASSLQTDDLEAKVDTLSALQDLSCKIELCLKKQRQVNFISREIADIVKKSS